MALKFASSRLAQFIRRRGISIAAASSLVSVLAAAGCGQLAHKERELTFRVEPGTASWYSGLPEGLVESNLVVQADGKSQNLHTWWWPADKPDAPAVLYLHGARWNLTGQLFRIQQLHDFGFSVLAVDYRGFGKSDGDLPSERTVYEDAQVAWKHLASLQPDAGKRFIYGHSLGGAIAIDLAAHLNGSDDDRDEGKAAQPAAKGLIVESSFTSLADIARSLTYPWLPLQLLLSQKFDSVGKISRVGMPVLIVHGSSDRYVPSRFSEKLYEAAGGRKKLILVEGGTHNNSMRLGATEYRQAFKELFGLAPDPA
ncbi:alpha/beta hydrolase [Noviherbaspirillum malthae]|uniref:alpha/beta hydrolase n=1 Tax=Noviherbaspirillum malthae TaxID=1260987 RepID=UPI00188DCB6F|nr:alpha/beta fold hydrolase [Noviherbaspirillum malthae]